MWLLVCLSAMEQKEGTASLSKSSVSVLHGTVIDIWDGSSAESPQTKFACIACLLILGECCNYGTFGFKGLNLT